MPLVLLFLLSPRQGQNINSQQSRTHVNLARIAGTAELFYVEFGRIPTMAELVREEYLKREIRDGWGSPIRIEADRVWTRSPDGKLLTVKFWKERYLPWSPIE